MSANILQPWKLCLFAVLSLADLGLTWQLLRDGGAYESNPVAGWWLAHYGWAGVVAYSVYLSWGLSPGGLAPEDAPIAERGRLLDRELAKAREYSLLMERL